MLLFVQKYFPYEKKQIADEMVEKIRDSVDANLKGTVPREMLKGLSHVRS